MITIFVPRFTVPVGFIFYLSEVRGKKLNDTVNIVHTATTGPLLDIFKTSVWRPIKKHNTTSNVQAASMKPQVQVVLTSSLSLQIKKTKTTVSSLNNDFGPWFETDWAGCHLTSC